MKRSRANDGITNCNIYKKAYSDFYDTSSELRSENRTICIYRSNSDICSNEKCSRYKKECIAYYCCNYKKTSTNLTRKQISDIDLEYIIDDDDIFYKIVQAFLTAPDKLTSNAF